MVAATYTTLEFNKLSSPLEIRDMLPLPLGIELPGDKIDVLIDRCTPIPTSVSRLYQTAFDDQSQIFLIIREGESSKASQTHKLGEIIISNLPKGKKGKRIQVTFTVDQNGILKVTVVDVNQEHNVRNLNIKLDN